MTNKNPIRIAVYGSGIPKVDFAFTGDPPYFVFDFTGRINYYMKQDDVRAKNTYVCDFRPNIAVASIETTIEHIKTIIETIKSSTKEGTIIVDRMTDLINYVRYKDEENSLPRTSLIVKEIIDRLIDSRLDLIMLFGQKEILVKDKPSGYYKPDWIECINDMIDFKIHALPNEYRRFERTVYAYSIMEDPTVSYLKSIQNPHYVSET
jgi:hypothetical protein